MNFKHHAITLFILGQADFITHAIALIKFSLVVNSYSDAKQIFH